MTTPIPMIMLIVAGCFALLAILFSLWLIYKHLRNYTEPAIQRPIIRILWMVPIYCLNSWFGIFLYNWSLWFDVPRDCYEAYALYQFFNLLVVYLGGEQRIIPIFATKAPVAHPAPLCYFSFQPGDAKSSPLDLISSFLFGRAFYRWSRFMILQFAVLKPILTVISLILELFDSYVAGSFSPSHGYLYITIVYNISICLALYYLVLFYMAAQEELEPFHPIPKFLAIKLVIFFTFWQGMLIALLVWLNVIKTVGKWKPDNFAGSVQDFLICLEMFLLALWHPWVFPFAPFRDPTKTPFLKDIRRNTKPLLRNFGDVLSQRDVLSDTVAVFHPKEIRSLLRSKSTAHVQESRRMSLVGENAPLLGNSAAPGESSLPERSDSQVSFGDNQGSQSLLASPAGSRNYGTSSRSNSEKKIVMVM